MQTLYQYHSTYVPLLGELSNIPPLCFTINRFTFLYSPNSPLKGEFYELFNNTIQCIILLL